MEEYRLLPWETANNFLTDAFHAYGVPSIDSALCADVLLASDLRGCESHGCNRFKRNYIDRIKKGIQNPITKIDVINETITTAVLDANDGMGMVASKRAMQMAIDKAKKCGMAAVAVRNSTHYGIAGYWVEMATKENMIGISGTNARPSVAPTNGIENMFGTNPFAFGMPTDEAFPFVLDCATSIIQRGKLEHYARIGKPAPQGVVIRNDGSIPTDSAEIIRSFETGEVSLVSLGGIGEALGGYKGYGYATVVEILSAALQAGSFLKSLVDKDESGNAKPYHLGHFFIVMDPAAFCGVDSFKKTTGDILRSIRNSKVSPQCERIYTAGEKEYLATQRNLRLGLKVSVPAQKDFVSIRNEKQLPYQFDFEEE